MRLQYHVKKIERKEQIEQCEKFFIHQYMWNSKQNPLVYGWMGYVEGEGLLARALQYEIDHLSGTLYVSKTENGIQDVEPIE